MPSTISIAISMARAAQAVGSAASARIWSMGQEGVRFRRDDVVIIDPSKCGRARRRKSGGRIRHHGRRLDRQRGPDPGAKDVARPGPAVKARGGSPYQAIDGEI
jgi:hypothetical protein